MGVAETMGDLTGRDLERRKQIYDAMPSVVVRVAHGAPGPQGERWLRPLERLDGRFLVDAEHDRVVRRVEVQSHDIGDFVGELRPAWAGERNEEG